MNTNGLAHVKRRVLSGFVAGSLGPAVSTFIQLVTVPLMLKGWGAALYGEWLVISAIPTYIALSDLGFASVAANEMTMQVAANDRAGAVKTYQSVGVLIASLSSLIVLLFSIAAMILPVRSLLNTPDLHQSELRMTLMLLAAYAALTLQSGLVSAGFRCDGHYPFSVSFQNGMRLLESVVSCGLVLSGTRPTIVAVGLLNCRVLGLLLGNFVLHRWSPWLKLGFSEATSARIRTLFVPAVSMMAFPLANSISFQGTTLLVGHILGPVAVVSFSTLRTFTRFAYQLMESVKNSVWPELSIAFGQNNLALARSLHRRACQVALLLSVSTSVLLYVIGPQVYQHWTRNKVPFNAPVFSLLLGLVVTGTLWNTSSIVAVASNRHKQIAAVYLFATLVALGVGVALTEALGLTGTALSLFVVDLIMVSFVLRNCLHLVHDSLGAFLSSLFDFSPLVHLSRSAAFRYGRAETISK